MGAGLESDIGKISSHLLKKQKDFDEVMDLSRRVVRGAGQAITMLHNGRGTGARDAIDALKPLISGLKTHDRMFRYASLQAYQEYAEAELLYHIIREGAIPSAKGVGVDEEAYLLGLMDVVGELKREVLERLREGDTKSAERYYETMREVYDTTRGLRFAESVLPGFRRKQDVARIQLESASGELLHASH